mmetsp:Transcript_59078/g.93527  ORF Transcript_59078/g.93527 Transcript_59078/m.93527 type:complete len:253 (-) Transcript_59078:70-828(-)
MALRPADSNGAGNALRAAPRRGHSENRGLAVRGHEASPPFGAMAPFGGSLFGGADPFQEFSSPGGGLGFGGSMMSRFDNLAAEMMRGFPDHGEMKGFSSNVPGGGSYSCQTFAVSSVMGKDGKMHTEKYSSSDVGHTGHGIREAQHAYSNSTSGVDKMGLERHLGDRARKMVKERNRFTMEEKCSEMLRGMDEGGRDHFDKDFSGLSRHLPAHGRGVTALADTGRRGMLPGGRQGPASITSGPAGGARAARR